MIQDIFPHHLDNVFHPGRIPQENSLVICLSGREILAKEEDGTVTLPSYGQIVSSSADRSGADVCTQENYVFLFALDQKDCFWLRTEQFPEVEGFAPQNIRSLRDKKTEPKYLFFTIYTAQQLIGWYRDNVFCGRCAARTVHSTTERALICPSCGRVIYPRIVPAVIVGVTDGDRMVLTKYAGRDVPYFALIAGFTEIGETLEETVAREVMEEVGLKVKNIRYYKSQPWGMADNILMGFYCDVDGDRTIRLDRRELKEGAWYSRDEIVLQPDEYSLTNEMMMRFKDGLPC